MRKYLHTRDSVDVEERMRIHNLIRDYTADAYGGWHQVTTLQAGGGLLAQRIMMNQLYDVNGARARAKRAAGIRQGGGARRRSPRRGVNTPWVLLFWACPAVSCCSRKPDAYCVCGGERPRLLRERRP